MNTWTPTHVPPITPHDYDDGGNMKRTPDLVPISIHWKLQDTTEMVPRRVAELYELHTTWRYKSISIAGQTSFQVAVWDHKAGYTLVSVWSLNEDTGNMIFTDGKEEVPAKYITVTGWPDNVVIYPGTQSEQTITLVEAIAFFRAKIVSKQHH
jgi:hypothetical protein